MSHVFELAQHYSLRLFETYLHERNSCDLYRFFVDDICNYPMSLSV